MLHWAAPSVGFFTSRRQVISQWMPWLLGITSFLLYAYSTAPGIVTFFDDTLEFQTVATFGIAHPTGYPLYTITGGLWTQLWPLGTWAGRLNLYSALCAAITVGLLCAITSRLVTHSDGRANLWAGVVAAVTFGLGPVWWSQATIAEVYALHGLFVAAILATTIGIDQSPHFGRHFVRRMTLLCFLFGLALTHHRTILLIAPPVALYLLWSVPGIWRPRRLWWQWGLALLLPLILYFYIPLRAAAGVRDLNGSYLPGWAGFWNHVLARDYGAFFAANELALTLTPAAWLELIRSQMGWLGLILAALGMAWLVDRHWRPARAWWLVMGVLLMNLLFAIFYHVPDPEVFLLPTVFCLAIFSGGGAGLLARLLPTMAATLLSALLVALLIVLPLGRGPIVDRHQDWLSHDQARRMAQANFPTNSRVIGLEGEMSALRYMQAAESLATNATLITANDPAQRRALVEQVMAEGLPLFLTREVAGIESAYSFSGDAGLVRVWPRGQAHVELPTTEETGEPQGAMLPLLMDEGKVQIEDYTLRPIEGLAQPAQVLTLYWRALASPDKVLKLSLRLVDGEGNPYLWPDGRAAIEDRFPLHQVALTPQWQPGELIQDVHTLQLPPILSEKEASSEAWQGKSPTLLVIIYDSATTLEEGRIEIKL